MKTIFVVNFWHDDDGHGHGEMGVTYHKSKRSASKRVNEILEMPFFKKRGELIDKGLMKQKTINCTGGENDGMLHKLRFDKIVRVHVSGLTGRIEVDKVLRGEINVTPTHLD